MKRVIIVGAGLIGAAAAFRLSREGWAVTVIDRAAPASGATGASFGWINASYFLDEAHFRLRCAGIAAHRRLEAELGAGPWDWSGCLWQESAGAAQAAFAERLEGLGYAVERLDRAATARRLPALRDPDDALFLPDEGAVDAGALTGRLLAASGAVVWRGLAVAGVTTGDGAVTGVMTAAGAVAAERVVLAAGVAVPELLAPLGLRVPLLPRPGVLVRTRPVDRLLSGVLCGPEGECRQLACGRILLPAAAHHQGDEAAVLGDLPDALAEAALGRLSGRLRLQRLVAEEVTVGWRPVPADGRPVLDEVLPGLTVAVMHSGVTLGPLAGEAVADLVAGRAPDRQWQGYGAGRFGSGAGRPGP